MPHPPHTPSFRLFFLLLCLFALAACAPKNSSTHPDIAQKYTWDAEETVEPYVPRDDGLPLSAAELAAFQSTGPLEKNLSQDDKHNLELHFKYFVHEHRGSMQRFVDRSARYLPYIKKIFRERGLPEDLAYLAIVESGGNPNAVSRSGAVGLWQFMPFTGKKFGLTQNSWMDERCDPFKATYAASDYLLKLYNDFSDWHLAVAAYNAGEGKIGRALEGTGADDFFELCRLDCQLDAKNQLKEETRQYVPRLLAVAKVMRNLRKLGFEEPGPEAAYDLVAVSIPPGTNLSAMARNLGLTWDEFSGMNPAFRRTASHPATPTTAYVIPSQQEQAESFLADASSRSFAGWREHTVRRRETLASIARKYGVSTASLREANGFSRLPKPGNVIVVPGGSGRVEPLYAARPDDASFSGSGTGKYAIQPGDTLFQLARAWGTDVESIRRANKMSDNGIRPGQRLIVPGNSKTPPGTGAATVASPQKSGGAPHVAATSHTVRAGDTLYGVANRYGVSVQALCDANGVNARTTLSKGRVLQLPRSGAAPSAASVSSARPASPPVPTADAAVSTVQASDPARPATSVTVQNGDTLFSLAKKNHTNVNAIRHANNMKPGAVLRPGQRLRLP